MRRGASYSDEERARISVATKAAMNSPHVRAKISVRTRVGMEAAATPVDAESVRRALADLAAAGVRTSEAQLARLAPREIRLLGYLAGLAGDDGRCRPNQVTLSRQLNASRSGVQRSLDRLVQAGWLVLLSAAPGVQRSYRLQLGGLGDEFDELISAWQLAGPDTRKRFLNEILSAVCSASASMPSEAE